MTVEEAIEAGWEPAEAAVYVAAREETAARLAAIMGETPPAEADGHAEAPRVGTPAWETEQRLLALVKQSDALDALNRREQPAVQAYDVAADERRRWALQQAVSSEPARSYGQAPGGEGMVLANGAAVVVTRKNGLISEMQPAVLEMRVILPHQWEDEDRRWRERNRTAENELLARCYGADTCVAEGLFTAEEAARLDPARSRHVPLPPGSPR